ncbi:MAG: MBL fold metallo-hydrolase [Porcipelethomonas sp.]
MKIHRLPLGMLSANCYIAETGKGNAAAIDIGGEYGKLKSFLSEHDLRLKKIFLTHGHFDHTGGVAQAAAETGAEVFIHGYDARMLTSRRESLADAMGMGAFDPVENFTEISSGDVITLDELEFEVIHTPGHTKGSVCYKCADSIFSGDTLFRMSMGRTDFPGGSIQEMMQSLRTLSEIPGNFDVYPGHNETTTLDFERNNNPYMNGNLYEDII